jgi:hypothetical protein
MGSFKQNRTPYNYFIRVFLILTLPFCFPLYCLKEKEISKRANTN